MDPFRISKGFPDSYKTVLERMTTDAVHRRLNNQLNSPSKLNEDDYYYCKQCSEKIGAVPDKEHLKMHFETIQHKPYCNCVYCSKPVFEYTYNKKQEIYHMCRYD